MCYRFHGRTFFLVLIAASMLFVLGIGSSLAQDAANSATPIWQAGSNIHDAFFAAQQSLLDATDGNDTTSLREAAATQIQQALDLYTQVIQPDLHSSVPQTDTIITQALTDAKQAALDGNAPALVYATGSAWTNLLRGSYLASLDALQKGDNEAASDWLRLREFRQATKFSVVDNPAAQAVARLQSGGGNLDEVSVSVSNDLRDAYTFRLRDALVKLKDTVGQNFATRTANWAGLVSGYFGILEDDFAAKRGADDTKALQQQLVDLKQAALSGDLQAAGAAGDQISTLLANYQPVALTQDEISKRAQLLYLFIDLAQVEYRRGVQDGKITIAIEYQEATTFRNQSVALFEELRPIMSTTDSAATEKLATQLNQMKAVMTAIGTPDDVQALSADALVLAKQALKIDANLNDVSASFTIIDSMLKDLKKAVLAGNYETAERKRLETYAILDAGIEQRLRGFAPDVAAEVESLFWQGTSDQAGLLVLLANRASVIDVNAGLTRLNSALSDGQAVLNVAKSAPEAVIGNAAIIVFREGLEGVLIFASLLAGMRAADSRKYRRSLSLGAGLAMIAAVIVWFIANSLLALLISLGERLEAVVSLIAIAVLLLITNWFFHKTYWTGWMANFHSQKGKILGGAALVGPTLGLIILGFTSVFREVVETILFLQSLVLDAGSSVVLEGVFIGLLGTAVVGFITFKLQVRLPYKKMLIFTGILIGAVLLTMVGNTVHVFQVVGWMPITPINGVYLPYWIGRWFGVFATWQGIILQFAAAVFVIGSYFWAERINLQKRTAPHARKEISPETALKMHGGD
ncbi:MAG: FTR1 family protein [Chloroflexota bacterium]